MSKVLVNETSLTAIGNAIRDKNGKSDKYKPSEMAAAIGAIETGGGSIEVEPMVLTGDCSYLCNGTVASKYIALFGNSITTDKITNASRMFYKSTLEEIPFEINMDNSTFRDMSNLFHYSNIKVLPKINNAYPTSMSYLFGNCYYLRNIPENYMDDWNFDRIYQYSSSSLNGIFNYCYSLRSVPAKILSKLYKTNATSVSYSFYNNAFSYCHCLDEVVGLPVEGSTMSSSMFTGFSHCSRLKNMIFQTNEDGSAKTAKWRSQTISLNNGVGYGSSIISKLSITNYNSGITLDKEVVDDVTYQALKDDPDWYTFKESYSRYNHDSAVATINSLPDTSAYLATYGGSNTIKFRGVAGSATDGGAINTLTEEEIAVAAAKGWTVSFT